MRIILMVTPIGDAEELHLNAVEIFHRPCSLALAKHRDPATNIYTLCCECGLEIVLRADGASMDIVRTSIDEQPRLLKNDEVVSNPQGSIVIEPCRTSRT